MFLVNDTREKRTEKIRKFMDLDISIAVIIAAADFEWTCRRCILALGKSPTKQMKETGGVLFRCNGLDKYKNAWKQEVQPIHGKSLPQVIHEWEFFKTSGFPLRHKLVHGISGTTGREYGMKAVESILSASIDLTNFAESHEEPIYGRKIVRRIAR